MARGRPRRRWSNALLGAALVASTMVLALAPAQPAQAATPPGSLQKGPAPTVGGAPSTSTGYVPVPGRFGSDPAADILWSGATESMWRGSSSATFTAATSNLQAPSLMPLVGNFDGDASGVDDVFWYGPGTAAERYWRGTPAGTFANGSAPSVRGTYRPVVGDFDGDDRSDIFWYAPGTGAESLWRGTSTGGFRSVATSSITRTFTPIAGDFNGDDRSDIYWYAPGSTAEVLWLGRTTGTFASTTVRAVNGTYTPIAGDFNGDGRSDIFWYAPGSGAESLWLGDGATSGRFSPVPAPPVSGTYRPAALDANGDRCSDILWYGPGTAPDNLFLGENVGRGCAPAHVACAPSGLDDWVWEGDTSTAWDDPANWAPGPHTLGVGQTAFPGRKFDFVGQPPAAAASNDDVVCVPAGTPFRPIIDGHGQGDSAHVLAVDAIGPLEITNTGKLELKGTTGAGTRASYANRLTLRYESTLFGSADLTITGGGELELIRDPLIGGPRLSTRDGVDYDTTLAPGADPLRIRIATNAEASQAGGGLNLWDEVEITNHGRFVIDGNAAYVAADYGTSFENLGTLELRGDGDYVQGFARAGRPLDVLTNRGTITKTQGAGESVIDADLTQPAPGTTVTFTGVVRLYGRSTDPDPPPVTATVVAGATVATGGCAVPGAACTGAISTVPDDVTASLLRPPGAATVPVTIDLAPAEPGVYGQPIDLTAATVGAGRMTFRVVLAAGTAGTESKDTIDVSHEGVAVPDCTGVGIPNPCVDRAASTGTAGATLTMVIVTSANGRWKFL